MYSNQFQGVLRRLSVMFEAGLCTLKSFQANIYIDQNARPKFSKARPKFSKARSIPSDLCEKVETKWQCLVRRETWINFSVLIRHPQL